MEVNDFPKLDSPFKREEKHVEGEGETYVVTPEINEGYEWVFEQAEKVQAVEKLDGTNMSIVMEDGRPKAIFARIGPNKVNRIPIFSHNNQHHRIVEGVLNAWHRGWLDRLDDGQHFGELVGPKYGTDDEGNVNPYDLDEHLFYPFARARDKLEMESYGKYGTEFEDIREWFMEQGLIPLFASRIHDLSFDEAKELVGYVEGVVFYHPETGEMAKLRRDMFPSYEGRRH